MLGAWIWAIGALSALAADEPEWSVDAPHGSVHDVAIDTKEGTWMSVSVLHDTVYFDLLGDLWSVPISGGDAKQLSKGLAWDISPRVSPDGQWVAFVSDAGGNEQLWLMKPDGSERRQVTHEEVARVTDPVWTPDGRFLVARRRTVDTRSIGMTELWQYAVDGKSKGFQLTSLDKYPITAEAAVGDRYVYFSARFKKFDYNEDPLGEIWSIQRLDQRTGEIRKVAGGAGGASRPLLTPDGKSLLLLSRNRNQAQLERMDLGSGVREVVADWLDRDEAEAFALHETYPGMDFADDGDLVLWAQGKLWRLDLATKQRVEIPFHVAGSWTFRDVPRWPHDPTDEVRAKVLRWPALRADGTVAVSAFGVLWQVDPAGKVTRLSPGTGYSPSWSADGKRLAWTSWSDTGGGRLHVTEKGKTEELPIRGQLVNPAFSEDGTKIAVLRGVGGFTSPDLGDEPWYEIVVLTKGRGGWTSEVARSTDNRGSGVRATRLYWHGGRIAYLTDQGGEPGKPGDTALVSIAPDGTDQQTLVVLGGAGEVAPSPDWKHVAYRLGHQVWVAALPPWPRTLKLGDEAVPKAQVTHTVGDWVGWSPDGKSVTWLEGPVFRSKPVAGLFAPLPKGTEAPKEPDEAGVTSRELAVSMPRHRPTGVIALTHARVVTMAGDTVLEDTTVVLDRDRISAIGGAPPAGAEIIDCTGKTIIPGLVDVHAHLHYTAGDVMPEQEWRYLTALDYGVTTVHDPSASTDLVFTQAERVEAGLEKGPRVYSTGFILYGALDNEGAETPSQQSALRHVQRLAKVGAISVKIYQQSQRQRRQWYAEACNSEHVMCVAEGGGDLWQNLTMFADGYHAVEHSFPNSPLYGDVQAFLAASRTKTTAGTAWTPTLLVAYGGLFGENDWYQRDNPLDDPRLLKHFPKRELDRQAWRRGLQTTEEIWNYQSVARDAAKAQDNGVLVTLGAHGQLQGKGAHWELWSLGGPGAMTPMEALRAATIDGATYLGMQSQLGSIEVGKLADLVVLDGNPLDDLHNSEKIVFTVKNGEVFR